MRDEELKKTQYADRQAEAGCTVGLANAGLREWNLLAEAEKNSNYHQAQAEKAREAAAFFIENPAFDKFIRLIRSGSIQI